MQYDAKDIKLKKGKVHLPERGTGLPYDAWLYGDYAVVALPAEKFGMQTQKKVGGIYNGIWVIVYQGQERFKTSFSGREKRHTTLTLDEAKKKIASHLNFKQMQAMAEQRKKAIEDMDPVAE